MKKKDSYTEIIIKEQQISSVHCCKSKNVGLHNILFTDRNDEPQCDNYVEGNFSMHTQN
jgi:hypothetical protein